MRINADFSRRAIVVPDQQEWVSSPQSGVERVMLDRLGAEKARATSIVRYAPESYFPCHEHLGGEEILVLSGTFSDENGHYPSGWYLRNPPGSSHQPYSREGAIIFVKLRQMSSDDDHQIRIDTGDPSGWHSHEGREAVCTLFSGVAEQVSLHRLAAGAALATALSGGAELLVLRGALEVAGNDYPQGSWIRLPVGDQPRIAAAAEGATLYLKTGHLSALNGVA